MKPGRAVWGEWDVSGILRRASLLALPLFTTAACGAGDGRTLVKMPVMMQRHLLASMRGHLAALDLFLGARRPGMRGGPTAGWR